MKRTLIQIIIILSLLLSPIVTSPVHAASNLVVSGFPSPYTAANGIYVPTSQVNSHDSWVHSSGGYYIYYHAACSDWEIYNVNTENDCTSSTNYFAYSSDAESPVGLSWSRNGNLMTPGSISVTEESASPVPEIDITGNMNIITDGNDWTSFNNHTKFVSADISTGATSRTYTIYNNGTGALTITNPLAISGTNVADFSITTPPASSVAAGGSTTFTITFNPTSIGTKTATITITNNDSSEGTFDFAIAGYGYSPENLVVTGITTPAAANTTYIHQGVLINYEYWLSSNGYYLYTDGNNWLIDNNTDPSAEDKVEFYSASSFTPSILEATNWTGSSGTGARGTGTPVIAAAAPTPNINVKGNSINIAINDSTPSFSDNTKYGSVDISSGSRSRTYTIENTGGAALTISGVTLGGAAAADFSVTTPPAASVAAFSSTTFVVTFDPTTDGAKTAAVSIANNDPDENPYSFTISGDAFLPKNLLVSDITTPSAANGTYTYQGILNEFQYWKHESQNYFIYNGIYSNQHYWNIDTDTASNTDDDFLFAKSSEAAAPVGLTGWTAGAGAVGTPIIGYAGPEMDVKGNGNSINDGNSTPTTSNDTDFGPVGVASGTIAHTFTINNTGYVDLNLSGTPIVAVSGTNSGDFTVTVQPTTPVPALTGTTTFTVEFNPSGGGTRSATISITNNDSDENPYTFNIQGTGLVAPTLTTSDATALLVNGATLGGNVTSDGGVNVTGRGVVYSTSDHTPQIGEPGVTQDANGSGTGSFSESITGMASATHYYYQAYAINTEGTSYGGVKEYTTLNQISAITLLDSDPTNASSVRWDVEFGATVTGLTASNFSLENTGLAGPSITSVTGSGTTWTVTANTGTGSGSFGLNLVSDAGLNAGLSNMPFTGEVYTIDRIPPTTTSFTRQTPAVSLTNADTLVFRVTFNGAVIDVDPADFVVTGATATPASSDFVSTGVYDITVSGGNLANYNGEVGLSFSPGMSITDSVGNAVANTEPTIDQTYELDNTAPILDSITRQTPASSPTNADVLIFRVTFNGAVLNVDAADFDVDGSSGAGVTSVALVSDGIYDVTVSGGDLASFNGTAGLNLKSGQNITDAAGNPLANGDPATDETYTLDNIIPSVSMSSTSSNPTKTSPIAVVVTFSESVTGFTSGEITPNNAAVSNFGGSGASYTFDLTPSGQGVVTADIAANAAVDPAGNTNTAATQFSRTYDSLRPTLTIEKAAAQPDPAGSSPINFTVVFNETVTGFTAEDVSLSGTAGAATAVVSGSGATYNVAVSGMTADGTVMASVPAGGAEDAAGNTNLDSTSSDNNVFYDMTSPSVTINQALGQPDPTNASTINFTVIFSEAVTGFVTGDVDLSGSIAPGTLIGTITGGPATYNVAVSGMTGNGIVMASIPAGAAIDQASRPNEISTSDDNSVTYDNTSPAAPVLMTPADGSSTNDATPVISGTAEANSTVTVRIDGSVAGTTSADSSGNWTFTLSSPLSVGSHTVYAVTADSAGNVSTNSNSNTFTIDITRPTLTIEQAASQSDPTGSSPINFTVVFNETVTGFTAEDVSLSGTAGAATAVVSGSGATYNVAVSGMTTDGTVIASVPAGGAQDAAGNTNVDSTSSDNSVLYDIAAPSVTINQALSQPDPTNASPINFTVIFSEAVTDFVTGDVDLSGSTASGTLIGTISGGPTTYNVAVSGMTGDGTVIASIPFGAAIDLASRPNGISTSDDNSVTYDNTSPAAPVVVTPADGSSIKDITPVINGTAEANSTVTVWIDGSVAGTANADSSGNWTFTLSSPLTVGSHTVYAVAVDLAGNVSANSTTNTFTVDVYVYYFPMFYFTADD
jgi:hypothetical protein